MSWTTDQVTLLIEEYERYPTLYMVKHPDYHNKHKRNISLQKIVAVMAQTRPKTDVAEITKKFAGLRSTYANERRKYLNSVRSGAGVDDIQPPSLWYYEKMKFLDAHLGIRKSSGSTFATTDSSADEASYFTEGEDVCSTAEQTEVFELTEISENDEVFSPQASTAGKESSTSAAHSPTPRKRRRSEQGTETEGSACLQDISVAMQTYVASKARTVAPDDDASFASYVHARLNGIKNTRRTQRVKYAIDTLLFNASEEADEANQRANTVL